MASIAASQPAASIGRRWALYLAAVPAVAAFVMFVIGISVSSWLSGGHIQTHSIFAALMCGPALLIARVSPRGGPASTPAIIGLTIAAFTQLVEGVGASGYSAGNQNRVNVLAGVHDIGVTLAPIGLIAAAVGVTLAVGARLRPRFGRWPAIAMSVVVLGGLGFLIAKMIGM